MTKEEELKLEITRLLKLMTKETETLENTEKIALRGSVYSLTLAKLQDSV